MDTKTVSLLKKHIRMIDYIRADLVAILGQQPENAATAPKPPSELYAEFDAAITAGKVTTAEGEHVVYCRCAGCVARRSATAHAALASSSFEQAYYKLPVVQNSETQMARALDEIAALFPVQVDGPAMAYFRLKGDEAAYEYETFTAFSNISAAYAIEDWRNGVMKYLAGKTGAIYWRVRPELATDIDFITDKERYKVYARLLVAPVGEVEKYDPGSERFGAGLSVLGDAIVDNVMTSSNPDAIDDGEPRMVENEPAPYQRRPLTDYEMKKQAIHEAHARGQMCLANDLSPGVRCMCPKCSRARAG